VDEYGCCSPKRGWDFGVDTIFERAGRRCRLWTIYSRVASLRTDAQAQIRQPHRPRDAEGRTNLSQRQVARARTRDVCQREQHAHGWRRTTSARDFPSMRCSWCRLEPGETKSDEARMTPLAPDLYQVLKLQKEARDHYYPDSPWVFSRAGEPILRFEGTWAKACKAAGLVVKVGDKERHTKLFHDLRRTGVRNLIRASVRQRVAIRFQATRRGRCSTAATSCRNRT
jgi:hypothetical protein